MSDPHEPPPDPSPPSYDESGGYRPTEALSYGWDRFSASPSTLMIPMTVVFVGIVAVALTTEFAVAALPVGSGVTGRLLVSGIAAAVVFCVYQLLAAGLYRGALRVVDGGSFVVGELFEGWDKVQVVVASLLISVAVGLGTVLCVVPGLVVGFLTQFTLLFVVDRQLTALEAIRASVRLVTGHLGPTLVFYVLAGAVTALGAVLCGVGLLVAVPVVLVGYGYTYRRLLGEPVVV
jgi:uncharacterized membrane protein